MNTTHKALLASYEVGSFLELCQMASRIDQASWRSGRIWNYENSGLGQTVIVRDLIAMPWNDLDDTDLFWVLNTIWFWHHHAISSAWCQGQVKEAQELSELAVELQDLMEDWTNCITRVLYHLVRDEPDKAREWILSYEAAPPDYELALDLIEEYFRFGNPTTGRAP